VVRLCTTPTECRDVALRELSNMSTPRASCETLAASLSRYAYRTLLVPTVP